MEENDYRRMKRSRRRFFTYWYTKKYMRHPWRDGAYGGRCYCWNELPKGFCPNCNRRQNWKAGELSLNDDLALLEPC